MNVLGAVLTLPVMAACAVLAWAVETRLAPVVRQARAIPNGTCPRCERLFEYCRCTPNGPRGGAR